MLTLPEVKNERNYPLGWLIGEFEGSGQLGGNFGLPNIEFESRASWTEDGDKLNYSFELKGRFIDKAVDEIGKLDDSKIEFKTLVRETGVWRQSETRPETLTNELQFPLEMEVETTWFGLQPNEQGTPDSESVDSATSAQNDNGGAQNDKGSWKTKDGNCKGSWKTKYLGIIGMGRLEMLSDELVLLSPETKFGNQSVNDLYRSKRVMGFVNDRVLWAWDLALLGGELKSFAAGGMWLPKDKSAGARGE